MQWNDRATPAQCEAWRKCTPGDEIIARLRSGNLQRFIVCDTPHGSKEGCVYAQKTGQGPASTVYRIHAYQLEV